VRVPDHRHAPAGGRPQGVAERLDRGDPAAVVGHDDRVGVEHRLEHLVGDGRRVDGAAVVVDAGDRVAALRPDARLGRGADAERARHDGYVAQRGAELVGASVVREGRDEGDLDAVEGEHGGDQPGAAGASGTRRDVDDRHGPVGAEPRGRADHIDVEQGVADHDHPAHDRPPMPEPRR
jgi:hypothetical protein